MTNQQIFVEDGQKNKCPSCSITYAFENDVEILFRNITLLYVDKRDGKIKAKCKQCKSIISANYQVKNS